MYQYKKKPKYVHMIKLIAAIDKERGLGKQNKLPWKCKEDMKHFKKMTTGCGNNAIIMGRNTWNSIGRELPKRDNYIISTTLRNIETPIFNNLESALNELKQMNYDDIWIIGGGRLYATALKNSYADELYITKINNSYDCDVFLPEISTNYRLVKLKYLSNECNLYVYKKRFQLLNRMYNYVKDHVYFMLELQYNLLFKEYCNTNIPWKENRQSILAGYSGMFYLCPCFYIQSSFFYYIPWIIQAIVSVMADYYYINTPGYIHGIDRWVATLMTIGMMYYTFYKMSLNGIIIIVPPLLLYTIANQKKKEHDYDSWVIYHFLWHLVCVLLSIYVLKFY